MWNGSSDHKRIAFGFAFAFVLIIIFGLYYSPKTSITYAESETDIEGELSEKVDEVLDDFDTSDLDEFVYNDFGFEYFDVGSFKELAIKILDGSYFLEYDNFIDFLFSQIKENCASLLSVFLSLLSLVILFELFKNMSADKYHDLKKLVQVIFSLVIVFVVAIMLKNVSTDITAVINKIFSFSKIIFPILLQLILLSGATGTFSVYSSLSAFLLNTGSYIFTYLLLPLSVSIFVLSLLGSSFSNKRMTKAVDIFKSIFKYVISIYFGLFGLFSAVNLISSGMKDGVRLKLTKFAIKNYVPVLGGYISEGFDFVRTCSVMVKNAFGISGIFILLFLLFKPLISYFVYVLMFKVLSLLVSYIGNEKYSDMFESASKCMSYFISVLVGVFMIFFIFLYMLILSVSVV